MLALLGYLRDGIGENTGTGTANGSGSDGTSSGSGSRGTGTCAGVLPGESSSKGSGSRSGSASKTRGTIVPVEVQKRMVTYAEWAKKGQANPSNLSFSPSLVARVR